MKKNAAAARGFLSSLMLLVVALVVFFVVLHQEAVPDADMTFSEPVAADLVAQARRESVRSSNHRNEPVAVDESAASASRVESTANPPNGSQVAPTANDGEEQEDQDVQKAITLVDNGNVAEAVTLLEEVLKRDPKNEQALVEMAMVQLLDLKQTDQAVGYMQRVIEVNPKNIVVMTELVSLYEDQGRVEEGLNFMMGVQATNPDAPELAHGVGELLTLAGRDQEAIAYYEKATQSPEYQLRAERDLADAYSRSGDSDKAIDWYTKVIQGQEQEIAEKSARGLPIKFPEERMAYTKLDMARELIRVGEFDRAQVLLDEISPVMPGDEKVTALRESLNRRRAG